MTKLFKYFDDFVCQTFGLIESPFKKSHKKEENHNLEKEKFKIGYYYKINGVVTSCQDIDIDKKLIYFMLPNSSVAYKFEYDSKGSQFISLSDNEGNPIIVHPNDIYQEYKLNDVFVINDRYYRLDKIDGDHLWFRHVDKKAQPLNYVGLNGIYHKMYLVLEVMRHS